MVNVTIDGVRVSVEENTTIMDAAAAVGVRIPRLCYLKDINEIAACRVCLVEVDGHERLLTSCNNTVTEGMVIHTNSPRVRQARRTNVQLILSQHDCRCAVCVRSGNCSLQQLANDMGCIGNPYGEKPETSGWNMDFPADPRQREVHQVHALHSDLRQGAESRRVGRDGHGQPHDRQRRQRTQD